MHGHVHGVGQQPANQLSAVAAAKTAAAQEAAATKRKLLRAAEEIGASAEGLEFAGSFGGGGGTAKQAASVAAADAAVAPKNYQWGSAVSHGVEPVVTGGSVSVWV